jgi:phage terminase small subunit
VSGLSDQQRRLADLVLSGKAQIEAHRLAGYKGSNDNARAASASEILRNPNVVAYMNERRAGAAQKAELTAAHFAKRLERIAAAAERTVFKVAVLGVAASEDMTEGAEVLALTAKDAADIARQHSMDAAKLLGLVIDKAEVEDKTVYAVSNRPKTDDEWATEYSAGQRPN